ncbi:MAG: hypothetical protein R3A47_05825 [Polyangiales bacterium]
MELTKTETTKRASKIRSFANKAAVYAVTAPVVMTALERVANAQSGPFDCGDIPCQDVYACGISSAACG